MNDAWNVIGWTAQDAPVIFPDSVNPPWQIPADIDTVVVAGEFHSMDGGLPVGYVEFKPSTSLTHAATKVFLSDPTFVGRIGMDGRISLAIPATDSPGLVETGWRYDVTVVVGRVVQMEFACILPKGLVAVNLFDLIDGTPTPLDPTVSTVDGGVAKHGEWPTSLDGGTSSSGTVIQVIDGAAQDVSVNSVDGGTA